MILLFITGYILYRVVAGVRLPEFFAARASNWSGGRTSRLLLSLICVCAALSMFIPNAVTVLAMIPVLRRLDREYNGLTTALTLSIIYGANIGGMGSLIGSPANLLLIGALDLFEVPGRTQINFFNWFVWALPVVIIFLSAAWATVMLAVPADKKSFEPAPSGSPNPDYEQRRGLAVFAIYMSFWTATSIAVELWEPYGQIEPLVCTLFLAVFLYMVFIRRGGVEPGGMGKQILKPLDLFRGLPLGGLGILLLLGAVIALVKLLELDLHAVEAFRGVMAGMGEDFGDKYFLFLVTALIVIFLTEIFSNTVVSTAFFSVAYLGAQGAGINPLPLMVLVSACSTCAFMTPIATPCNSLAFGEMRNTSIRVMLSLGLLLNLTGGVLLSYWMYKVLPLVYG